MISIIGGSGFVGTELISQIGERNCINYDKKNSKKFPKITRILDITIPSSLNIISKNPIIILLATEHKDDVTPTSLYYDVNVNGTKNVLLKMNQLGIKNLIFTSSVAIYGLNKNNPDENFKKHPFNHYGKSKWEAEK